MEQISRPIIKPVSWFTKLLIGLGKILFAIIIILALIGAYYLWIKK
ncbi:MAG: hypothetical protein QT11_C0001G0973 [archaeon GW2011_AR20]|nr:MAG: hypothetical protein QT11_C0001G0973 [archaeon GW2011_AR20]